MIIHLHPEIESSIQAAVHSGHFASVDDAMTKAATLLLQLLEREQAQAAAGSDPDADPLLGLWRDSADEMDEIVANAYRKRREDKWRDFDL
jgi:Arc/MetJ-type ribon-helix-helix transcriptional regulator